MGQILLTTYEEQYRSRIIYIFNRFHMDMLKIAKNKLVVMNSHNPDLDAEDAVQRAFLRITKDVHNLEVPMSDDKLRCYAYTVVLHEVMRITNENKKHLEFHEEIFED